MRAIDEIRRVAYDLRPPVLDGMGVVGAIREYAAVLGRPEGGPVDRDGRGPEDGWPVLPAAVEVATYRIVTEALTNVVRHSSATAVTVRLDRTVRCSEFEVLDNGINAGPCWEPGVGLTSVRERTAELGGASELRYDRTGGQVRVTLPIGAAQTTRPVRSLTRRRRDPAGGRGRRPRHRPRGPCRGLVRAGRLRARRYRDHGRRSRPAAVTLRRTSSSWTSRCPIRSGIDATRDIRRAAPDVAVLMLTMFDDDASMFAAMRAGARGYVLKGAARTTWSARSPPWPPARRSSAPVSPGRRCATCPARAPTRPFPS